MMVTPIILMYRVGSSSSAPRTENVQFNYSEMNCAELPTPHFSEELNALEKRCTYCATTQRTGQLRF